MHSIRELVGGVEAAFRFVFCHLILEEIGSIHGEAYPPHVIRGARRAWKARERKQAQLLVVNKSVTKLPIAAG